MDIENMQVENMNIENIITIDNKSSTQNMYNNNTDNTDNTDNVNWTIKNMETKVKLPKTYYKILYLYPAYNNTFVFLGMVGLRQDCVTHVDANGNILFQHIFPKPMDAFGMMQEDEVILLQTRSKWYLGPQGAVENGPCITVLNLRTYKFTRTYHHFFNEETDQSHIRTFANTKYLCIQEDGRYNDNHFKLSYYNYPLQQKDEPFNVYSSKKDQWTYEYIVKQANNHSMIAWFKARHDNEWSFRTYDLRDDFNGKFNIYIFKQQVGIPYGMTNVQVAMNTMWETVPGSFMLVCISNKTENQKNKQLGVVQNNYICNTKTSEIRQAKFSFGELHDLLIDQTYMGRICMFRTFDFKDGKPLETPIYYVQNKTEKIIFQRSWECSYLHKDQSTGVSPNMLIHNTYENGDCDWFTCSKIQFVKKIKFYKQHLLSLIIGISVEFDLDLLQDTLELIVDKQLQMDD